MAVLGKTYLFRSSAHRRTVFRRRPSGITVGCLKASLTMEQTQILVKFYTEKLR